MYTYIPEIDISPCKSLGKRLSDHQNRVKYIYRWIYMVQKIV